MVFRSQNPTFSSFECSTGRQYSICLLILEEGIKIDFQLRGFVIWTYEKKNRDTFWSKPPPELEKWQIWTRIYRARVAKVSFKTLLQPRFSQDPHKIANCFWPCGVRLWEWVRSKAETSTRPMTCKRSLLNEIWLIWVISKFQISAEIAEISTPRPTAKLKYSSFLHEIQILQAVCGAQSWEWVHSKAESSVLPATC